MIATIRQWLRSEPPTKYERTFHSERFQEELNRLRDKNEGYRKDMQRIYIITKEDEVLRIAARALGKPRP